MIAAIVCLILSATAQAQTAPSLSLVTPGSSSTIGSIAAGTPTYSLDLVLNSGTAAVGGLELYLQQGTPLQAVTGTTLTYGADPVLGLGSGNAFADSDVVEPTAGAAFASATNAPNGVNQTAFFRFTGAYPAVNGAVARYQLDTDSLLPGAYTIIPIGTAFSDGATATSTFGVPGSYTLTVVPEPTAAGVLLGLGGVLAARRRRPC